MKLKNFATFLAATMLIACGGEKKQPAFWDSSSCIDSDSLEYDIDSSDDYEQMAEASIITIPFTEKGGVKYVGVSVNGFGFEMIFDTGCSSTLISVAEANYLYQKGYLKDEDILDVAPTQIADGSIVENVVVNLKEVIIGGKIRCTNVTATVSGNDNAPLLLGNEVLDRVAAYAVDNEHGVINFKLK